MANHKSAEKRARQTERRTAVNSSRRSRRSSAAPRRGSSPRTRRLAACRASTHASRRWPDRSRRPLELKSNAARTSGVFFFATSVEIFFEGLGEDRLVVDSTNIIRFGFIVVRIDEAARCGAARSFERRGESNRRHCQSSHLRKRLNSVRCWLA